MHGNNLAMYIVAATKGLAIKFILLSQAAVLQ